MIGLRLTQLLDRSARQYGTRVALIEGERHFTYRDLQERVAGCAGLLARLGAGMGDRVCVLALNSHRYLEALFGAAWLGAISTPLNYRLAPDELAAIVEAVSARFLLTDAEHLSTALMLVEQVGSLKTLVWIGEGPAPDGTIGYEDGVATAARVPDANIGGDAPATIFFTGGTTGRPKGVVQSHANLVTSALMYVAHWGWREDLVLLGSAPMFHVAAAAVLPPALLAGGRVVIMPRFEPAGYAALIEQHAITFANGVPTMLRMVVDDPGFQTRDVTSLRGMNMGGSPIPVELQRRLVEAFPRCCFYNTYGMTEATSAATVSVGIGRERVPTSEWEWRTIGRSMPLMDVAVFDAANRECAPGTVGELHVRGPLVMRGYWNDPAATAAAITGDGWLRTGDLGLADTNGNFFLVDRLKDMIITGGENVYSAEVEAVIRELPGVSEVAVVGLPHEKWGETVHAAVVPHAGAAVDEEAVITHCRARAAAFKAPRSVAIRAAPLPLSGAGKVAKDVLRREYAPATLPAG